MSARPSFNARKTTFVPVVENAGLICWSSSGMTIRSRIPPSRAFNSSRSRPRSRRANTATVFPSGETPMSPPLCGPVVTHCDTMYSYVVV